MDREKIGFEAGARCVLGGSEVILEVPMFICEKAVKHVEGACCKEGHRKLSWRHCCMR